MRKNGLSIVLLSLFLLSMAGQAVAGWVTHNQDQEKHGQPQIPMIAYFASGHFWEATGENWESEFLQMAAFVLLTTFLYQAGSAESKRVGVVEDVDLDPLRFRDQPEVPGPVRRGGWLLTAYEHSLGLTFTALFLVSFAIHAVGGLAQHNTEELAHGEVDLPLGADQRKPLGDVDHVGGPAQ